LKHIENLDFIENPVYDDKEYSTKLWATFDKLKVLDGYDKDGEECLSEIDDDDFDGEGEEFGEFIEDKDLTEEERKELERQGFQLFDGEGEEYGSEGEDEAEGDGEGEDSNAKAGVKRTKEEEVVADDSNKRQKTDE
jgi:hypothetical protein